MNIEIKKKLNEAIVSASEGIDIDMLNDDINLIEDLNFDSINIVQLVVEIENTFDIVIDDDSLEFEKLAPFQELYQMVCNKIKA